MATGSTWGRGFVRAAFRASEGRAGTWYGARTWIEQVGHGAGAVRGLSDGDVINLADVLARIESVVTRSRLCAVLAGFSIFAG